jgi:capsular polysaccharide biosynthesis protein
MQTNASPKEPFTLSVLFRYKFTILVVAFIVIVAGYLRIITQPRLFEATVRMAVRFTSDSLPLGTLTRDNLFRLPLLEEEVKAYMVQIKDPKFIDDVLQSLPPEGGEGGVPPEDLAILTEPTAMDRFRVQFLRAYYNVRTAVLSALDTILFTDDTMLSEREQQVSQVLSRLEVAAGTEASHIITLTYRNLDAARTAQTVNSIALKFIELQKARMQREDEVGLQREIEGATKQMVESRTALYKLTTKLESPTIDDAIKKKNDALQSLLKERDRLEIAKKLIGEGIIPFDRDLPLEAANLSGALEQEFLQIRIQQEVERKHRTEAEEFHAGIIAEARKHIDERRKEALERDRTVVEARLKYIEAQIAGIDQDHRLQEITPDYTRLTAEQTIAQANVAKAQENLSRAREFNKQLQNENVSQSVTIWQRAQVPTFPMPQSRPLKLLVVIVLGVFAGAAAALARHQLKPKPVHRVKQRHDDEIDVPLIILPDDGKRPVAKDLELDISFPADEGAEEELRGSEPRR